MEAEDEREVKKMALRALMKRKELERAKEEIKALREQQEKFPARESELEAAIEEAETDEERAAVEEEITEFESEQEEIAEKVANLEERIEEIEAELKEIEKKTGGADPATDPTNEPEDERRVTIMNRRNIFKDLNINERAAMFARDDVQAFVTQVREVITNKRGIKGADLLIPDVFLGMIRENVENYSKLYKHVNARQISGSGTVVVMGTIPEAVWTDCCGALNELDLSFNDAEVGCWRVGGYLDVCNATVEDSDMDLASEILTAIGQAIGIALDKAIMFGLGTRMPLGIFTRLAQTKAPNDYPTTARPWADLHTSNIKSIAASVKGVDLFREFLINAAAAKGKYSRGEKVWIMNEATYSTIVAAAMAVDAGGAVVSGVNGTMPVVGGTIEVLEFVPDNVIIGGYMDLYLLAERAGTRLDQSEHCRFIEDRTVFRGTARYDGLPVIPEGFVAIGINGTTPAATGVTFAPDTANAHASE